MMTTTYIHSKKMMLLLFAAALSSTSPSAVVQALGNPPSLKPSPTAASICPRIKISLNESCPGGCWTTDPNLTLPDGTRQCNSVGVGYFSPQNDNLRYVCPQGSFSNTTNASACVVCPAGTHSSSEGRATECDRCPAGTYSGVPGSSYCAPCLRDFYDQAGANAAELWNGRLYCHFIEAAIDDETTAAPSMATDRQTSTPTRIRIAGNDDSESPSAVPSATSSSSPASFYPTATASPTLLGTSEVTGPVDETLLLESDKDGANTCNGNATDRYEWHGRCKRCQSRTTRTFYPFMIVIVLASVITVLQYMIPTCFNVRIWCGVEFLQMAYLLGLSPISWPPIAKVLFTYIIPTFAMDVNAGISIKCILGLPSWSDNVLILSLPVAIWVFSSLLAHFSKDRIVLEQSIFRWLTIMVYMGQTKLVITSIEAMRCRSSNSWMCSDSVYSIIAGIVGLLVYGVGFSLWFLRSMQLYLRETETPEPDIEDGQKDEASLQDEKASIFQTMGVFNFLQPNSLLDDKASIFQTMGVFHSLKPNAWWWPGALMLRKMVFGFWLVVFPNSPFTLLGAFATILVFTEVAQRYYLPFADGAVQEEGRANSVKWFTATFVDSTLRMSLAILVGLAVWVKVSSFKSGAMTSAGGWAVGILLLVVLTASFLLWIVAVGHACLESSWPQDCSPFITEAAALMEKRNAATHGPVKKPAPPATHQDSNMNSSQASVDPNISASPTFESAEDQDEGPRCVDVLNETCPTPSCQRSSNNGDEIALQEDLQDLP